MRMLNFQDLRSPRCDSGRATLREVVTLKTRFSFSPQYLFSSYEFKKKTPSKPKNVRVFAIYVIPGATHTEKNGWDP